MYKINGINKINDKIIDDSIFDEEKIDYRIEDRENLIDNLIDWISEAGSNDKDTMKEDLKDLMDLDVEYILSSINTNEYYHEDEEYGQILLEKIYKL